LSLLVPRALQTSLVTLLPGNFIPKIPDPSFLLSRPTLKIPDLTVRLIDLILTLSLLLPCSQKLGAQSNQAQTNRLVQKAPTQLLEGAQGAQIFVAQSSHVQRSHDL
jgi:hypothetical protein